MASGECWGREGGRRTEKEDERSGREEEER